jgi:hypothetical protein
MRRSRFAGRRHHLVMDIDDVDSEKTGSVPTVALAAAD